MSPREQQEWQDRLQGSSRVEICAVHHGLGSREPNGVIAFLQIALNDLLRETSTRIRVFAHEANESHRCGRYPYSLPEELWDRVLAELDRPRQAAT